MGMMEKIVRGKGGKRRTIASIEAPSMMLLLTDITRAAMEFGVVPVAMPALMSAPRGDGHPVLVLPGFATSDLSTTVLRNYLTWLGYDVYAWELGHNLGPKTLGPERQHLIDRIIEIHQATGKKLTLIGWSLGGVMARNVTLKVPEHIRQIVTIGSPFTGNPYATSMWKLYEKVAGIKLDSPEMRREYVESARIPPVPSTAIYSKLDGIVAWQNCVDPHLEQTDNIEVMSSHMGMCVNPAVLFLIADRLSQPEGAWKHFDRATMPMSFLYPSSGHAH